MEVLVKKALMIGVLGIAILIAMSYAILTISNSSTSNQPGDVVAGWAEMFFITVGIVCSMLLIGIMAAWWTYADSRSINDSIKASLIAGVTSITILAVFVLILLISSNTSLFQLFIIGFSIFYLIVALFSVMGCLFYLYVIRYVSDHVKNIRSLILESIAAGVLPGLVVAIIIVINGDHLNKIPLSHFLIDIFIFILMACLSGIISSILSICSKRNENFIAKNMISGSIVGIVALTAPLIISIVKTAALSGPSVIFLILLAPLAIIGGMTMAILGSALKGEIEHVLKPHISIIDRDDMPFYWHSIKLGIMAGIVLAVFMFLPIPIAALSGDAKIDMYNRINQLMTVITFFLVPLVEVFIGVISAKYFSIKTTREAAVAAGIASSISVLLLFAGNMANSILQIYFVPYFTPGNDLLSLNAYMFLTNFIMCYPFVIVALIAIAMTSGVVMAEGRFKNNVI